MLKCRSFLYIFFRSFLPEFPRGRLLTLAPLPIHFLWCSPQDTQVPSSKIVQNMQSNIMLLKVFLSFSFDVRRSRQPSSKLNTAMVPLARLSKVTKHRLLGEVQNLKRDNKWLWQPVSSRCSWFPLKENGCFLLKSGAAYFELKRAGTWFDYFHLQGLQERPIPASVPSHPPWTWHLRKPNTSGTGIWSYCCFSPWDNLCKDFTFSEIHSGPCLAAGCSALALWVRPSRLKLYSALWRKVDSSSVEKSRLKLHSAQWRKVDQNFKLPHLLAIYRGKATKSSCVKFLYGESSRRKNISVKRLHKGRQVSLTNHDWRKSHFFTSSDDWWMCCTIHVDMRYPRYRSLHVRRSWT